MPENLIVHAIWSYLVVGWPVVVLLVGIHLLRNWVNRPSVKGLLGERMIHHGVLKRLKQSDYRIYHDLYLPRPDGKGTTQIDHVLVSKFGIFVIETKNLKGWIFGDAESRQWTQSIYSQKRRFQNPLHQNALHVNALAKWLKIDRQLFHNLVFFCGEAKLKTQLPKSVVNRDYAELIKSFREPLMSPSEEASVNEALSNESIEAFRKHAKKRHVSDLKKRVKPFW